jgi:hypothetical protein
VLDGFAINGGHKNRRRIDDHQADGLVIEARDLEYPKKLRAPGGGVGSRALTREESRK